MSLVLLDFVINSLNFLTDTHFYNKFFLNGNGLSDNKVVSFTKSEYGSLVYSLQSFMKSLKPISDKWFEAICRTSLLLGMFMIK